MGVPKPPKGIVDRSQAANLVWEIKEIISLKYGGKVIPKFEGNRLIIEVTVRHLIETSATSLLISTITNTSSLVIEVSGEDIKIICVYIIVDSENCYVLH